MALPGKGRTWGSAVSNAAAAKRTWRPIVAGVLQMLACIPYVFCAIELFFFPRDLPATAGGGPVWAPIGIIVWLPFLLPLLAASISALTRRAWGLALFGGLAPLVLTVLASKWSVTSIAMALFYWTELPLSTGRLIEAGVYGSIVVAAALLVWSRREFVGRTSAAEQLYGPPKWWKGSED